MKFWSKIKFIKLYTTVALYIYVTAMFFWDKIISHILGYLFVAIIGTIILLAFIIANFFNKKTEIIIAKNSPLDISRLIVTVLMIVMVLIQIFHFPFKVIPQVLGYMYWLSVGLIIGVYWQWKYEKKW